eukprot:c38760_g1_i1 orf=356-565(+)
MACAPSTIVLDNFKQGIKATFCIQDILLQHRYPFYVGKSQESMGLRNMFHFPAYAVAAPDGHAILIHVS